MKKEHLIPLSRQAIEIIEEIRQFSHQSPYLFPNIRNFQKTMSENTMNNALGRMGYKGIATSHGFRTTASTILNESGFNPDAIEKALAHEEENAVRKAYNRALYLDERREMMQWWADYLDGLREGAKVVPLRRKAI